MSVHLYIYYMGSSQSNTEPGFFQRLIESIFKPSDPEAEKRRIMRAIAKELSKTKFKFYRANSDEVLPAFAKTFFSFYKTIAPAQSFFQSIQNPKSLQLMVIYSLLSDKQIELIDQLSEENIEAAAKQTQINQLKTIVRSRMDQLFSEFDSTVINKIDTLYTQLILFKAFCEYDYFFLLRKFTSTVREYDFSVVPQFDTINGKYIVDDLKDFISTAWIITEYDNWKDVFALLKKLKGVEPVAQNNWQKLLSRLRELQRSRVFEMMLQLIQQNPGYTLTVKDGQEHITESFLDKIRQTAEKTISRLQTQQKISKIDSLATSIFGTEAVTRLKNYTADQSSVFEKRNVGSFVYQQPLNYLKAFLLDYIKKDVRELSDLVLVRGKWATASLSSPMSESYHALIDLSDKITEFDESLSDNTPLNTRIKNLLGRHERDKEVANMLHTILSDINGSARELLVDGIKNLIIYAKNIKMVLEDYKKTHPELIINWKELEHFADRSIADMCVSIYKQLYQFVSLMQNFMGNSQG